MKKSKVFFSLIVSIVLLFAMTIMSKAVSISSDGTPTEVYSGSEFTIILKLDEQVSALNAHISYNPDLITISDVVEGCSINPTYSTGDASFMYAPLSMNTTTDTFKITATAAKVTEEKTAEFIVSDLQGVTADNSTENMESKSFSVTIKPTSDLSVSSSTVTLKPGETQTITATGTGTLTWTSSDEKVATVDSNGKITAVGAGTATITVKDEAGNTQTITVTVEADSVAAATSTQTPTTTTTTTTTSSSTSPSKLSKTGESEILAIVICGIILLGVIIGIRFKKLNKLFVMLPLLLAVSFGINTSEAATVDNEIKNGVEVTKNSQIWAYAGVIDSNDSFFGITANSTFLADSKDENKVAKSDIEDALSTYGITNPQYSTSEEYLKTGDTVSGYTIVIYGDANADGIICFSADFNVIKDDYVYGKEATGAEKLAADVFIDDSLNVFDIVRLIDKFNKYDSNLGETLVSKDPFKAASSNVNPGDNKNYVAEVVGGEKYETLQAAITSVQTTDETTINLLQDITSEEASAVGYFGGFGTPGNLQTRNIKLDLKGYNITYSGTGATGAIYNTGTLEITNSNTSKQSTISAANADTDSTAYTVPAIRNDNNLTITGNVKISGKNQAINCDGRSNETTLNIDGENILIETTTTSSDKISQVIYLNSKATATIKKATIKAIGSKCNGITGNNQSNPENIVVTMESGTIDVAATAITGAGKLTLGDGSTSTTTPLIKINGDNMAVSGDGTLIFNGGVIEATTTNTSTDISDYIYYDTITTPTGYTLEATHSDGKTIINLVK